MEMLADEIQWNFTQVPAPASRSVFWVGGCIVDPNTRIVQGPSGKQRLRRKECDLLNYLFKRAAASVTREELLRDVWNCNPSMVTRTVDQTISSVRKKIEADAEAPQFLQTVYGIGYRLVLS